MSKKNKKTWSERSQMVAAIVPAFNEEKTIGHVIKALKKSELIDEVIVVSDGSTDNTVQVSEEAGADKVINLSLKSGKGNAMVIGVDNTDAEIIYFCDADLLGFTHQSADRVIRSVLHGKYQMGVGLRDKGKFVNFFQSRLPLISGERAMHRWVLERIPDKFLNGFGVEAALNYYCNARKIPYGTVMSKGVKIVRKMQKVGFWKGLVEYLSMFYQIIRSMLVVRLHSKSFKENFMPIS